MEQTRGEEQQSPDWLTAAEAASMARVSRQTVHAWVEAGQLRAVRLPSAGRRRGRIRIDRSDLLALLARPAELAP